MQHIVNVSGGKDSTAVYLLAMQRGRPFRAVMADTGHEHPLTVEYARLLSQRSGGPEVETVRADFSAETLRGGRQLGFDNWLADQDPDEGLSCSSQYGLCE
mgnify:CR=1 FL=1